MCGERCIGGTLAEPRSQAVLVVNARRAVIAKIIAALVLARQRK